MDPSIGKRLRAVRGEMDQSRFARHLRMSQQAISNYERGNVPRSWRFLRELGRDFGVSLNWLLLGRGSRSLQSAADSGALPDDRAGDWARSFLDQMAFEETEPLDLLIHVYFLYLATPADAARTSLGRDVCRMVEALRLELEGRSGMGREREALSGVYDAVALGDRRAAALALIEAGEWLETVEKPRAGRSRRAYLAALSLARQEGWRAGTVEAARRIGRSYRKQGRWHDAEFFFGIAIAAWEGEAGLGGGWSAARTEVPDSEVPETARARALLGYGHVAREQGDLATARERYLAALRWALESGDPAVRAEVYLDLACLSYREKDLRKAAEFVMIGRTSAEAVGDPRLLNQFDLADALVLREQGRLEEAEPILRALVERSRSQGDVDSFVLAALNLAEVLADRGSTEEAERLLHATESAAEAHGNPRNVALRKLLHARLEAERGQDGAAHLWLVDALGYARDHVLRAEFEKAASFWSEHSARQRESFDRAV